MTTSATPQNQAHPPNHGHDPPPYQPELPRCRSRQVRHSSRVAPGPGGAGNSGPDGGGGFVGSAVTGVMLRRTKQTKLAPPRPLARQAVDQPADPHAAGSRCESRRNSSTNLLKSSGFSILLTWPAPGITRSSEPRTAACICFATLSGLRVSPSPHRSNVGLSIVSSTSVVSVSASDLAISRNPTGWKSA